MPRSSGSSLYRFVKKLGAIFGMSPEESNTQVYEAEAGATPRSVEKASKSSGKRATKAREAKAAKRSNARKPAARKVAHRAGAKMADADKADTKSRAKSASRAHNASGCK